MFRILSFAFLLAGFQVAAQTTVKIVDAKTGEAVPYANIQVNAEHSISNSEGYFTISEVNSNDDAIVDISYLGYAPVQTTVADLKRRNLTVSLQEAVYELSDVEVSNVKPDPEEIMKQVKANLEANYKADGQAVKNQIFWRRTNGFAPSVVDVEIDKSTGFNKAALKETNAKIQSFTKGMVTHPPQSFTDMLVNYYSGKESKMEVVKATQLADEKRSASLEGIEENASKLFLAHIDTTKFYRFKTGWFGSRDTISFSKEWNKKNELKKDKKKDAENNTTRSKTSLASFIKSNGFLAGSDFDFVTHPEWYDYELDGATYVTADQFVWVLKFKPRKRKANYTGKLYISETDYAVVRADYELAKGKTLEGINLRLLLGLKFSQNFSKGTVIYKPNTGTQGYHLQYASEETGTYFYLHRPIKFIELTDEEKDVVAFDIKVEGNIKDKTEFLNISRQEVSAETVAGVSEKEFTYQTLKKYDPSVWKNYSALEPLAEMKKFEATE